MMNKTLIIGFGNADRGDDGAAWHALRALAQRLGRPAPEHPEDGLFPEGQEIDLWYELQLTPEMAEDCARYAQIYFIDAHTGNLPEEILLQPVDETPGVSIFTHHMTPAAVMAITRSLYHRAPRATLLSIRGYDFEFSRALSERTARLVEQAVELLWEQLVGGQEDEVNEPLLFIVTGSRGAGKTTFCASLARAAQAAGWHTAGLISHAVFSGSLRTSIQAEDLATGGTRTLATRKETEPAPGSSMWKFDEQTLRWGNAVLKASAPCDLLVVDELGPLEFEQNRGWLEGLAALDARQYAAAFVVVRGELLPQALLRWPDARIIEIDTPEDSAEKARILSGQLF